MIHLHLTEDDARAVVEGLGRLRVEADANVGGDHLTADGRRMLRAHSLRLRLLQEQLQLRLSPVAATKRASPRKAKPGPALSVTGNVEAGFTA